MRGITLWILPLGLIAGWSNENMGPAVWILSLLVMILRRKDHKRIPLWMYLGNISCLVGSILMIVAPGNFVRSEETSEDTHGLLWNLFLRLYSEAKGAFEYLFPALLLTVVLLVICAGILREKSEKRTCCCWQGHCYPGEPWCCHRITLTVQPSEPWYYSSV